MNQIKYFKYLECNLIRRKDKFRKNHPEFTKNCYPEDLQKIIEKHIEVYGHAYCMDLEKERRKISKLICKLLNELSNQNLS